MIKIYVGVTDNSWFDFLRRRPELDEVNFWKPSGDSNFRAIEPGSLFVFKLKAPRNVIGGFGIFSHSTLCPVSLAWEAFEEKNGAASLEDLRAAIATNRRVQPSRHEDFTIGCRVVTQPVFFDEMRWIPPPANWSPNLVSGKSYDVEEPEGRELWERLQPYLKGSVRQELDDEQTPYLHPTIQTGERFGRPTLVKPRLGQGAFRLLVTDAYGRKCAVTEGKVLPALDVAHIRPYSEGGEHAITNGLLLRKDIHTLLDRGYVTIDPSLRFVVSDRVRTEFNNGEEYRRLHGRTIAAPDKPHLRPDAGLLAWHNEEKFLG
ncbi:MAG TPA: HNH endonuclease [Hyphomicrobiaceae bacterium]|nr:HNH endonuclease [Hyphomicrobiaceae bacterium]